MSATAGQTRRVQERMEWTEAIDVAPTSLVYDIILHSVDEVQTADLLIELLEYLGVAPPLRVTERLSLVPPEGYDPIDHDDHPSSTNFD